MGKARDNILDAGLKKGNWARMEGGEGKEEHDAQANVGLKGRIVPLEKIHTQHISLLFFLVKRLHENTISHQIRKQQNTCCNMISLLVHSFTHFNIEKFTLAQDEQKELKSFSRQLSPQTSDAETAVA